MPCPGYQESRLYMDSLSINSLNAHLSQYFGNIIPDLIIAIFATVIVSGIVFTFRRFVRFTVNYRKELRKLRKLRFQNAILILRCIKSDVYVQILMVKCQELRSANFLICIVLLPLIGIYWTMTNDDFFLVLMTMMPVSLTIILTIVTRMYLRIIMIGLLIRRGAWNSLSKRRFYKTEWKKKIVLLR